MIKRILQVVGGVVALLVLAAVGVGYSVFGGLRPLVDGAELPGGAVQVVQSYTSAVILDAGDGQVALIDCNDAPGAAELVAALAKRKLTPDAVAAIFLTHGHPDHVGGCQTFPKAKVYAFAADVDPAAGKTRFKGPLPGKMDMPPEKRVTVTDVLKDGESVTVGKLTVLPLAVPGHTGGSAAFVVDGVAYLGDNAAAKSDGTLRPAPWIFTDDPAENVRSLGALSKRLAALQPPVKLLAFSHSGVAEGISALKAFEAP